VAVFEVPCGFLQRDNRLINLLTANRCPIARTSGHDPKVDHRRTWDGIYVSWIALRRCPWLTPFEFQCNGEIALDVMTPADKLVVLQEGTPLSELRAYIFATAGFIGFTLFTVNRTRVGYLQVSWLPRRARWYITGICSTQEAQEFHQLLL
jgi:hypothetical protein